MAENRDRSQQAPYDADRMIPQPAKACALAFNAVTEVEFFLDAYLTNPKTDDEVQSGPLVFVRCETEDCYVSFDVQNRAALTSADYKMTAGDEITILPIHVASIRALGVTGSGTLRFYARRVFNR